MHFNSNTNTLFGVILVSVTVALLLALSGCMETTTPANQNNYSLGVRVYQYNPQQPNSLTPLRGVQVNIADPAGIQQALQGTTNDNGVILFNVTVPLIGSNFNITANNNGRIQSKSSVLICRDTALVFLFDTAAVPVIACNSLNGNDSLIFVDEIGFRLLFQNSPQGVNRYEACYSIANSVQGNETITAVIPQLNNQEFRLENVFVNGEQVSLNANREVQIPPGGTLTVCFSAFTNIPPNQYNSPFNIALRCGANQGNYTINLNSTIIQPTCTCNDIRTAVYNLIVPQRVQVGQSVEISEVVFTNDLNCTVTISQASFQGNNAWTILSPNFPQTLQQGQSLTLRVRFAPQQALESTGRLDLLIRPEGSAVDCQYRIDLTGNGCNPGCPLISKDRVSNFQLFGTSLYVDTLSNRRDNRVFVNIPNVPPTENTSATRTYYIFNPDSACNDVTINVQVTPGDRAAPYYTVTPSQLTLSPGEVGTIDVTFIAPLIADFEDIVAARGNTGRLSDSLFKVNITLTSLNCIHRIDDNAVVTKFPDISPIINLRAYSQRTPQKQIPENEVYSFGADARTINKGPGGALGEYPPRIGDIWIDVADTNASANPPQNPILKLVNSTVGMKIWRSGQSEDYFSNVPQLYQDFLADGNSQSGYSNVPINNLQVGDIIAFDLGGGVYALIYIRRVDNGTENTSSKQSGIEFRSIYPVYNP